MLNPIRWFQSATYAKRARIAAGVVAVFSFIISYSHLHEVAYRIGENRLAAILLPLVIDIAVIAGIYMGLSAAEKGHRRGFWAWLVLWTGGAATVAGNLVSSDPGITAKLGSIVAPVFMIITIEVLSDLVSRVEQPEPEPTKPMTAREMVRENPSITAEEIVSAKGCGLRYAQRVIEEERSRSKELQTSSEQFPDCSEHCSTRDVVLFVRIIIAPMPCTLPTRHRGRDNLSEAPSGRARGTRGCTPRRGPRYSGAAALGRAPSEPCSRLSAGRGPPPSGRQ